MITYVFGHLEIGIEEPFKIKSMHCSPLTESLIRKIYSDIQSTILNRPPHIILRFFPRIVLQRKYKSPAVI